MITLWDRVASFIAKHGLLTKDGLYIVAVSGGADSVALLLVLQKLGYRIEAAHCNFNLRGEESKRDELFVKELCNNRNIPLHLIHFDTTTYANLHKVSIEMAARELRYRYFEQLRQDIGAEDICVAHHRDDAVETFIMNMLRGTGIHGLTGIRPRNGHIVRPLLNVSREDIEIFLDSIGQKYVTDSSNLVNDVIRNKIRLDVLPLLKSINPSAPDCIYRTATLISEAEKVYNSSIESAKNRALTELLLSDDGTVERLSVSIAEVQKEPSPEAVLHELLSPYGFNSAVISKVADSLEAQPGSIFSSDSYELVIDRDTIILQRKVAEPSPMTIPEEGIYNYCGRKLKVEVINSVEISKNSDCATVDADKVTFPLIIRTIKNGDRFVPFGMSGSRLVSDYLTDRKVNVLDKRRQLVVTDTKEAIVWLVGHRTDNRFRIADETRRVMKLCFV